MGKRVQEMLERQIRVPPRDGLAEGNVQHDLDGGRKHQASSMAARSGNPASAASDLTVSALVSATSNG